MPIYSFKKIDAFARDGSSGNPAGEVYLQVEQRLAPEIMQKIALELKGFVSEVAFVTPLNSGDFELKFYSSEREVDFCGHATIAIMYDLLHYHHEIPQLEQIQAHTNAGPVTAYNRLASEDAVYISAPPANFLEQSVYARTLAAALDTPLETITPDLPLSVINAGLTVLVVPMTGLDPVLKLRPDEAQLKDYCQSINVDIVLAFSREAAGKENHYRSRVFAPTFGYLEDPATGSGNAALGYYLHKQGLWDGELARIEQNGSKAKPNLIRLKYMEEEERMLIGGGAAVKIAGEYILS